MGASGSKLFAAMVLLVRYRVGLWISLQHRYHPSSHDISWGEVKPFLVHPLYHTRTYGRGPLTNRESTRSDATLSCSSVGLCSFLNGSRKEGNR